MRRWLVVLVGVPILLAVLAGFGWVPAIVANPDWTPPSGPMEFGGGYRLSDFLGDPHAEVLTALAFSGGGKRSAAFSHGVLRGLRSIPVRTTTGADVSLLDEVDYIAAVSGGSFPAMHYGLYRERSFETFPAFLHEDLCLGPLSASLALGLAAPGRRDQRLHGRDIRPAAVPRRDLCRPR